MWPFKKIKTEKTIVEQPQIVKIVKKPVNKTTNKTNSNKKTNTNTNKIYVGDKNKIVTLRLSHNLLEKVKHHAKKNKKMTL